MTQLLAYHNDPSVKDFYLARVHAHIKADRLVPGIGWNGSRGCAIGCTLETYEHDQYPIKLGMPEWLARVEDTLFEGMSAGKAATWPLDFLSAAHVGADLDKIKGPFLIVILERVLTTFDHAEHPQVKAAVDGSIALWRRDDVGSGNWQQAAAVARSAARSAAWEAAEAAEARGARAAQAARAAAWAGAWAVQAAQAAEAAVQAALAGAWAVQAAWAAEAEAYDYFAAQLLVLMRECVA